MNFGSGVTSSTLSPDTLAYFPWRLLDLIRGWGKGSPNISSPKVWIMEDQIRDTHLYIVCVPGTHYIISVLAYVFPIESIFSRYIALFEVMFHETEMINVCISILQLHGNWALCSRCEYEQTTRYYYYFGIQNITCFCDILISSFFRYFTMKLQNCSSGE